jgi:hypothetical protein
VSEKAHRDELQLEILQKQRIQARQEFVRTDLSLATLLATMAERNRLGGEMAEYKRLRRATTRVCAELQEFLIKYREQLPPGEFRQAEEQLRSLVARLSQG